ncbi:MAG TPA: pyridoxamine 5'-phosphate oxidase family protein [Syntrophales bacterium]|nr:pyridoxamine 5'-phosphate oxidase family protein [Syntrophales bacterium]
MKKSVELSEKTRHVFIATVNEEGIPHIAASKKLSLASNDNIVLTEWFCPGTMSNLLRKNHNLAIVMWDSKTDIGYQLIGEAEKEEDTAYLDGYSPDLKKQNTVPQIQRKVTVRINRIIDFKLSPHTDIERR